MDGYPGIAYSVVGDGGNVTASLCSSNTDFDTVISIGLVSGDCESVTCMISNDDACGSASAVTFKTLPAETYLIYVHGFVGGTGSFELAVTSDYVSPSPTTSPLTEASTEEPTSAPTTSSPTIPAETPTCNTFGFGAIGNMVNGAFGFLGF